jgi:hypothetical protein
MVVGFCYVRRPTINIGIRMSRMFKWTIALHLSWFPALFVAWGAIAGQSGSPVPDNWPVLARILDILGVSALVSFLLLGLMPVAYSETSKVKRWAAAYPILLLLNCGGTVVLSLTDLAHTQPQQAFVAPRHNQCWRFGKEIPALDAVGKPIRPGDLLVIQSAPGSDGPLPDTPEQAAQRKAWDGRIVTAAGTMQGGALRFNATGEDGAREAPRFCLWPDQVVHVRMH